MKEKLTTLGRNHPKALGAVFTATLLTHRLFEYGITPTGDGHPGP